MRESQDTNAVEQIVASVLATRKYRNLCADTVRRFAAEEWTKLGTQGARSASRRALKQLSKATRSRLHQAYGAYEMYVDYERAYQDLEGAYVTTGARAGQEVCKRLLTLHASTRERLSIVKRLYREVFAHTGLPDVLLDPACGLNPLSLPWMGLEAGATYYAYDIDRERVEFLNRYFVLSSMTGVQGRAFFQDILSHPPVQQGEIALLLKSSACLERQRAGATLALLDALQVRHAVVSFPVHSLGRRKWGMLEHYERTFAEMLSDRPWPVRQLRFETELVFLVDKG
jgi:16S rRNA (guanine(1405)-N(7))-methyltransferase